MMNRVFRLTRLAGLAVAASLTLGVSQVGAIVDGTPDETAHPSVGIVYFTNLPATLGFCSGSLLSPDEFLTAGHCTATFTALGLDVSDLRVSFDTEVSLSPDLVITTEHSIAVTGWDTHPAFKTPEGGLQAATTLANDVGVIHLAENVYLAPIDLPDVGFLDAEAALGELRDHVFIDVGYGLNGLARPAVTFNSPGFTFVWHQRREALLSPFSGLTPEHLLTQGGALGGDSGGPVFYDDADPSLVVATMAGGDPLGRALVAGQRLDTQAIREFLDLYR